MSLIGLLVALIIIGVMFWAIRALSAAFGIPQPIVTVLYVILVVLVVIWLLGALGAGTGLPELRLR
jgi:hypothetical protein